MVHRPCLEGRWHQATREEVKAKTHGAQADTPIIEFFLFTFLFFILLFFSNDSAFRFFCFPTTTAADTTRH